jgi:hypothetical protein
MIKRIVPVASGALRRRVKKQRGEAEHLRREAGQHFARAGEQEATAEQAMQRAQREREEAQETLAGR